MAKSSVNIELKKVFKPVKKKEYGFTIYDELLNRALGLKLISPVSAMEIAQKAVLDFKQKFNNANYCLFDTETTGNDQFYDEVIQAAFTDKDDNIILDEFYNSIKDISQGATNVHGITKKDTVGKNYFVEKIHEIVHIAQKYDFIIIYNRKFDVNVVDATCFTQKEHGIYNYDDQINNIDNYLGSFDIYDPMETFGQMVLLWDNKYSHWKWLTLDAGAENEEEREHNVHAASKDCIGLNKAIKFVLEEVDLEILQNTVDAAKTKEVKDD